MAYSDSRPRGRGNAWERVLSTTFFNFFSISVRYIYCVVLSIGMEYEPTTPEELMKKPLSELINRCKAWCDEFNDGRTMDIKNPTDCPVHMWVVYNHRKCGKETVPNIATCPVCGNPCCPDCMNHKVEQLSRVTGYIGAVSGWNKAKQQELKDRHRYEM